MVLLVAFFDIVDGVGAEHMASNGDLIAVD